MDEKLERRSPYTSAAVRRAKRNSCKMNKETGEVNEIFKLDFFALLLHSHRRLSVLTGKIMAVIFSTLGGGVGG